MALTSDKIAELWPDHAEHNDARHIPSFDRDAGYLCGCGEHLGWPVQDEPPEADDFEPDQVNTTFQRPASPAGAAAWDKAAAQVQKARQGAYGVWNTPTTDTASYTPPEVPEPEDAEIVSDDDPPEPGDTFLENLAGEHAADWAAWQDEPPRTVAEQVASVREHADGPVADEAQTYSVGGAGDGEVEYGPDGHAGLAEEEPADPADGPIYDATKDPEWRRVQDQSDADDPATHVTPDGMVYTEETTATPYGKFDAEPAEVEEPPDWDPDDGPAPLTEEQKAAGEALVNQVDGGTTLTAAEEKAFELERRRAEKAAEFEKYQQVPGAGTPILGPRGETIQGASDPVHAQFAPIDPTQIYTPADIENQIMDLVWRMENGEYFLRVQIARLHKATHRRDRAYNLAISKSAERAADQRKATAWLACEAETYEQTEAEMLVRALRDTLHALRSTLSGLQTVNRSIAASMQAPSRHP